MSTTRRVILDTDPGIGPGLDADDLLAILFCAANPGLKLEGVTTVFGNIEVTRATDNALRTLEAAGHSDVPVAMGNSIPLSGRWSTRAAEEYAHQAEKLEPVDHERVAAGKHELHAVDFIIETVLASPGEISLIAVGPQTNVAMALLKEPSLKEKIRDITIMGGAFGREATFGRGNITPVAELNMWCDPLAASVVFESGVPLTAVGLDITNPAKGTVLYEDQLRSLVEEKSPFTEFLWNACKQYIDAPKFNWAKNGCVLYDPLAAAVAADPSLVTTERAIVHVETQGEHSNGQTIAHYDENGHVQVCVDVEGTRFIDVFVDTISSIARGAVPA